MYHLAREPSVQAAAALYTGTPSPRHTLPEIMISEKPSLKFGPANNKLISQSKALRIVNQELNGVDPGSVLNVDFPFVREEEGGAPAPAPGGAPAPAPPAEPPAPAPAPPPLDLPSDLTQETLLDILRNCCSCFF